MLKSINKTKLYRKGYIFLFLFLLIELIVRPLLQPDPWLLEPSHWYFDQPLRLLIEFIMVSILFIILIYDDLEKFKIKKGQISILFIASIGSIIVFTLMELEQLKTSFSVGMVSWSIWFLTGFFIGVGQEFIYRGLFYNFLIGKFTYTVTLVIVTLAFVFMPLHSIRLFEYLMIEEYQVVLLLILIYSSASILFTWLRKETQTIVIPAVVHGLGNAITWVAVFAIL